MTYPPGIMSSFIICLLLLRMISLYCRFGCFISDTVRLMRFHLFCFFPFALITQPPFIPKIEITPFIEVLLVHDTYSLCSQICFCIIAVIRLIISLLAYISRTGNQPFCFKVSYKVSISHRIIPITEVSVYQ